MKKIINMFLLFVFTKFIVTTSTLPFFVQADSAVYGLSFSEEEEIHSHCKKSSEEVKEMKYIHFYNKYGFKQLHGASPTSFMEIQKFTKKLLVREIPLPPPDMA